MNKNEYLQNYWKQYLLIEEDFKKTLPYITLDTDNLDTFSSVYLKLILEVGAEIDNVFKEICGMIGRTDICDYITPILSKYPNITNQKVSVIDSNIIIQPFNGWNTTQPSQSLAFWEKYNSIKHERILNRKKASLSTSIHALGGLFILLMYRINDIYMIDQNAFTNYPDGCESDLLILEDWEFHIRSNKVKATYPIFDDSNGGERII